MMELLLGDEAVGLAALHAGIGAVFSYPGTPATEILEFVRRRSRADRAHADGAASAETALQEPPVAADWSANEKAAYEEALGMSYAGSRALVSMKHVGLNVAADPFVNSALTGANGGLVLAVADDPGMHSSQNEQDSRYYGHFAQVPVLEPADQQEAYDMTRDAFELSEALGLPVMIRLVTRLAHSRANVRVRPPCSRPRRSRAADWRDWTLLPANARRRYQRLLDVQPAAREALARLPYDKLTLRGPQGVIASGIANNYVAEALGDDSTWSVLKIGSYPISAQRVRELVDHCGTIVVVEEGYPFIESQLRGLLGLPGKSIRGKLDGALPAAGELTADLVARALGREVTDRLPEAAPEMSRSLDELPGRPPQLCSGCPHCDTYRAILAAAGPREPLYLFSDIGCYTLSALPPYSAIDTCVDMGASIGMALGAVKAGARPVIATIGDSTFIHSGMTPLIGAAKADADMTVVILDNAAVAMTGGQEIFATGDELVALVRGLGVPAEHVIRIEPLPKHHQENVDLLRHEIEHRGLSVIIASRPCIQLKRRG